MPSGVLHYQLYYYLPELVMVFCGNTLTKLTEFDARREKWPRWQLSEVLGISEGIRLVSVRY